MKCRENYYKDARDAVASLREAYDILSEHKPDLVRAVQKENTKKVLTWIGIGVTALSVAVMAILRAF